MYKNLNNTLSCSIIANEKHNIEEYIETLTKPSYKKPSMYKVLMLNDDFTPMDFVVSLLETIFNQSTEDAVAIMLNIHNMGLGVCGVFTYEIAETKVREAMELAKKNQYPLQCILEKE